MRVLLADDEQSVRSAFRLLLEQEPGVRVVGEVSDASSLIAALEATGPDVVILDWDLPGFEPTGCPLRDGHPPYKVIATSGRLGMRMCAMAWGADAFISKTDPPERVLATLRAL